MPPQFERRILLKCLASAFGGFVKLLPSTAGSATELIAGERRINWDKFVGALAKLAASRLSGAMSPTEFVETAAATGATLDLRDTSLLAAGSMIEGRRRQLKTPLILAEVNRQITFEIVLLSLEAGYSIPLHDHPKRNVVSLCAAGSAAITNYDPEWFSGSLILRKRSHVVIQPSESGLLTDVGGNVHTVTATTKTEIIDIISPPAPANGGFHWYTARPSRDPAVLTVTGMR